jgi:hypothetical protein
MHYSIKKLIYIFNPNCHPTTSAHLFLQRHNFLQSGDTRHSTKVDNTNGILADMIEEQLLWSSSSPILFGGAAACGIGDGDGKKSPSEGVPSGGINDVDDRFMGTMGHELEGPKRGLK